MAAEPDSDLDERDAASSKHHTRVALDGHVHIQAEMPWSQIADNFAAAAPGYLPVCVIVECAGIDRFAELASRCEPWGEHGLHDPRNGLRFVAGRQVVSAEGLEILLIGSRDQSQEGQTADRVIANGLSSGAAICLPWGFGKWLGARRRLTHDLYARFGRQILLGDITNRPAVWREPLFSGERLLRGSDNLPLPGGSDSVGEFGTLIETDKPVTSAEQVVQLLRDHSAILHPYGKRKSARASVGEQWRLRFNKGQS